MRFLRRFKNVFLKFPRYSLMTKSAVLFLGAINICFLGFLIWMELGPLQGPPLNLLGGLLLVLVLSNFRMVWLIRTMEIDAWRAKRTSPEDKKRGLFVALFLFRTMFQISNLQGFLERN